MGINFDASLVQMKILANFLKKERLSYTDGKPDEISNDLYKYHLGFLLSKGVIEKKNRIYFLSEYGKRIIQNFDVHGSPKQLFKVSVLIYLTREVDNKKQILMQTRLRQPYFGDIETVSGKINPGELIEKAAKRKLTEETGLSANIRLMGIIRKIRINNKNKVFEDTFYHACLAKNPVGILIPENEFGNNFWVDIKKAKQMVEKNKTYGKYTKKMIDYATGQKPKFFYLTEIVKVKNI